MRLTRPPFRVWVWTAATVALVVVAALLWRGSDAAATESTTAAPAEIPLGTTAAEVSALWSVAGDPVPADVVEAGRVFVGSPHGVRALDPLTGEEAWHYTRSNARLCGLAVTDGVAVAVFRTEDRCDEAVALHADTGVRAWTRNVSYRGDATLSATDGIVLASSPTGIVTLDPTGNNTRWRYNPPGGCRLLDSAVGSAGVAVLQRCAGATAVQLKLFDGFDGSPHWTRSLGLPEGTDVRLLGAARPLGVLVEDEVQVFSADDGGGPVHTWPVIGDDAAQAEVGTVSLIWTGDTVRTLRADDGAFLWEAPALGVPADGIPTKLGGPAGAVLVPDAEGVAHRDPLTGDLLGRSAVEGLPPGGTVGAIGPVLVHRLPDRVTAYS